jgi:hypothetical protein
MARQPLSKEINWFGANRANLLDQHEGKWAIVHGEELLGAFDTFEEAYSEGIRMTGGEQFLVKRISETDEQTSVPALTLGLLNAPSTR